MECVRYCSPLWATSTFSSENTIFYLKQCVHGTKGVYEQIVKETLQANCSKSLVTEVVESPTVKAFCNSLFSRHEAASFCCSGDFVLIGRDTLDPNYRNTSSIHVEPLTFDRSISPGMVIHSKKYTKSEKSKDTVFQNKNKRFVTVLNLINSDGSA